MPFFDRQPSSSIVVKNRKKHIFLTYLYPDHLLCCGSQNYGIANSGIAHSRIAHSGIAHSGIAHSGIAHSGIAHSGIAHSGIAHSGIANNRISYFRIVNNYSRIGYSRNLTAAGPDRKVDIKDNHLGIKLIPMISTWDQVDPIFPVRGTIIQFIYSNRDVYIAITLCTA
jgi:hypothetical protein